MRITSLAVDRPIATAMVFLIIIVVGIMGFRFLPVDLLPPVEFPQLTVRTNYPNVGPEEIERTARLRAAIALAAEEPPIVDRGDAVAAVGRLVAAVPAHALPVVVATWMLCYLSIERQHELLGELDRIGTHRDVALVFAEQPERVPGLPVPPRPDGQPDGRATALVRMEWRDGDRTEVRLADMHPHGRWIEWLEEPAGTAPADSDPDGGLG